MFMLRPSAGKCFDQFVAISVLSKTKFVIMFYSPFHSQRVAHIFVFLFDLLGYKYSITEEDETLLKQMCECCAGKFKLKELNDVK